MSSTEEWMTAARASYDTVAETYAEIFDRYPDGEPHDRMVLALFAERVRAAGGGLVADVGCGPGHITAHLAGLGLDALGIDLSPGMIAVARRRQPGLRFQVGSMTGLDLADASLGGYLAWYSLIHVPDDAVGGVLAEAARVVRPGGIALLGFHVGTERRLVTKGYGAHRFRLHAQRRPVGVVSSALVDAGFVVEAEVVQDPHGPVVDGRVLARRT